MTFFEGTKRQFIVGPSTIASGFWQANQRSSGLRQGTYRHSDSQRHEATENSQTLAEQTERAEPRPRFGSDHPSRQARLRSGEKSLIALRTARDAAGAVLR